MAENTNGNNLPSIEEDIESLQLHIANYRDSLNQEGIWLFLATLGCWSVTQSTLQITAILIALFLFSNRMRIRSNDTRTFNNIILSIEQRIMQSLPDGDSRRARLYDLMVINRDEISTINSLRNIWVFILCWLFWGGSLLYFSKKFFLLSFGLIG